MDSGNSSGSLQSSPSGGDDEYDSRAESISAFFNHSNPPPIHHHVASSTHSNPPPTFFDPSSNYLDPVHTSPSLSNFDMVWSRPGRSDPNRPDLGGFNPSSSSNQAFFSSQLGGQTTQQHGLVPEGSSRGLISVSGGGGNVNDPSGGNINTNNNSNVVRNPKKRSRASRRAPTTVLTTDTTNFRAMVQEFTGIPAPPFPSSPFQRSRLDLLGSHHAGAVRSPPPPTYNLLRPFAQKPHQHYNNHPFLSSLPAAFPSTTVVDPLASSSTTNSNSILYPSLSSDLSLLKQPNLNVNIHNNNNNNNPVFNFPSSIQLGSSSKTQAPLGIPAASAGGGDNSHLKMGMLEEFGLNHHVDVNTGISGLHHHHHHQNIASSSSEWGARTGTNNNGGGDHGGVMRSASGNLGDYSERDINGKVMNYTSAASSSDFHGEKAAVTTTTECVAAATRSEGMVESWINCSTD